MSAFQALEEKDYTSKAIYFIIVFILYWRQPKIHN